MASLAASAWPKPVALVPCLAWTSGSVTFCQGVPTSIFGRIVSRFNFSHCFAKVMAGAIDWRLLTKQLGEWRDEV